VVGMTHERQVRVENQGNVALHLRSQALAGPGWGRSADILSSGWQQSRFLWVRPNVAKRILLSARMSVRRRGHPCHLRTPLHAQSVLSVRQREPIAERAIRPQGNLPSAKATVASRCGSP